VAQNSSYHRTLALSGDFFFGFKIASAHRYSHEWYTETVQNTGSLDGFYYSPWLDHSFPSLLMAQGRVGALMTHEEQIAEFSTFGNVAISNGTYTITEATDAGIYKLFTLPVGARSLKFRYRFTSAGDGDFLSVHWGANAVLYVGPDLPVSRDNFIDADVPVAAYAGQTDQLVFKLVSRGTTNAVLVVDSIALSIDDDPDGDELTTDQEIALGTDPLKYDTDGDGLSDGDEVNIYHTNPLVADTDGDGMSDGQEVIAGTDPNDPSSVFQITSIQFADGTITLTWPSATGKSYSVYGTTDLSWNDFTTLTNGVAATPPTNSFADVPPASLPNFFYRVGVSQ
jgi:hypothetical protein